MSAQLSLANLICFVVGRDLTVNDGIPIAVWFAVIAHEGHCNFAVIAVANVPLVIGVDVDQNTRELGRGEIGMGDVGHPRVGLVGEVGVVWIAVIECGVVGPSPNVIVIGIIESDPDKFGTRFVSGTGGLDSFCSLVVVCCTVDGGEGVEADVAAVIAAGSPR